MDEKAFTDIQETLAHHEHQIDDLNEIIIAQGKQIDALNAYIRKLKNKVDVLEHSGADGDDRNLSVSEQAMRDKPPHY